MRRARGLACAYEVIDYDEPGLGVIALPSPGLFFFWLAYRTEGSNYLSCYSARVHNLDTGDPRLSTRSFSMISFRFPGMFERGTERGPLAWGGRESAGGLALASKRGVVWGMGDAA